MNWYGARDLLGRLLQVAGGEHVRWIDKQVLRRVQVETCGVVELRDRLLVSLDSAPIDDVTFARDCFRQLAEGAPALVEVATSDRDHLDPHPPQLAKVAQRRGRADGQELSLEARP